MCLLIVNAYTRDRATARWYEKNKKRLSEKRKKLYAEDPEYRQRALEASRRRRDGEPTPPKPSDAQISFAEAAERIGIGVSTLHEYRRKKLFPDPKHYCGRLWFNQKQVLLLKNLKEFFRAHGKKPWKIKLQRLKEVVASIWANWD